MRKREGIVRNSEQVLELPYQKWLQVPDFPVVVNISYQADKADITNHAFSLHRHDCRELIVITDGAGIQHIDGVDYFVNTGDVYVIQENDSHFFKDCDRDSISFCSMLYDADLLNLPINYFNRLPGYNMVFNAEPKTRKQTIFSEHLRLIPENLQLLKHRLIEIAGLLARHASGVEARGYSQLIQMFIDIAGWYESMLPESAEDSMLSRINNLVSYIEQNFDRKLTLAQLAAKAYCSERTMTRAFRFSTGCSPIEYILRVRLRHAAELLNYSNSSITEIAFKCGFTDANYFSRQFTRQYGVSARQYRCASCRN